MAAGVVMDWLRPQDSASYVPPAPATAARPATPAEMRMGKMPVLPTGVDPDAPVRPYGPAPRDPGGFLNVYYANVNKSNLFHVDIEIKGTCLSACTVYLGAKNACVHPDAMLWFHAAHDHMTMKIDHAATAQMARYWPPAVRDWARRVGVFESVLFTRRMALTGEDAIKLGARRCG